MDTRKWISAESTICLNFSDLTKKLKANILDRYPDIDTERFADLMSRSLEKFSINKQFFEYTRASNNFGGYRWYINCPECGTPVMKLYLPSGFEDRKQLYLCKKCHRLRNASVILGRSKKYENILKPLKRLETIRNKLTKKGLSAKKAKPLIEEYERIEKELANSPEYRLYKFKKEIQTRSNNHLIV